jgi:hypothetical protein
VHFLPRGGQAAGRASGPQSRAPAKAAAPRSGYRAWERLPSLGVAPAFAAAASQATGLFLDRLPLSPEVIQQCLQSE